MVLLKAEAYVDGSFYPVNGKYGSGVFLLLEDGQKYRIHYGGVIMDSQKQKNGSLIGELKAAEIAVAHALELKCSKITIFHDYMPVSQFVVTPPKDDSPEEAKLYSQKMREYMKHIPITFEHVKAHSGDRNNFVADQEARIGAGISAAGLENQTMADRQLNEKTETLLEKYSVTENVVKASPVRIYVYACRYNDSVYYSVIKRTDKMSVTMGNESSRDAEDVACRKIIEASENAMETGAENIVVFSKVENIIKYGNRTINPSSRTVDEKYKRLSLFCTEARKHITLSVREPESEEEIADYARAEAEAKKQSSLSRTDEGRQVFIDQMNEMFNDLYIMPGDLTDGSTQNSIKIYTCAFIAAHEVIYSVVKFSKSGIKILRLESAKGQSSLEEPAAVICDAVINACRKEIRNGADDITVFSKFTDVIRAGNGAILSRDKRYEKFADFCAKARETHILNVKDPASEDDMKKIGIAKRIVMMYRKIKEKMSMTVSNEAPLMDIEEAENKKEEGILSEKETKIVDGSTAGKASYSQSEDSVMNYLTLSAEMSKIQMQMSKAYTSMSDEDKTRLKNIAGYITMEQE